MGVRNMNDGTKAEPYLRGDFNLELLAPAINYAQTFRQADGTMREASDRWRDALQLVALARECFAAARG